MYTEPRETTQDGESHKNEASNDSIFRHLVSLPELSGITHNNYYGMGASGWRGGVRVQPKEKRTINPYRDPFLVINGNPSVQRHHGLTTLWGLLGGLLIYLAPPMRKPSLGCTSWGGRIQVAPCINPSNNCSSNQDALEHKGSGPNTSLQRQPPKSTRTFITWKGILQSCS